MAKRARPQKGWYPKWLERQRHDALGQAEQWIAHQGGDRRRSDPGLENLQEAFVAVLGEIPTHEELAEAFRGAGIELSASDYGYELGNLALQVHRGIRWVNFGMPTYLLDADTAAMLALTDVDRLKIGEVKFPYPTFLVVLAPGTPLYMTDGRSGASVEVRMIWVTHYRNPATGELNLSMTPQSGAPGITLPNVYSYADENATVGSWLANQEQAFGETMSATDIAAGEAALRLVISLSMYLQAKAPGRRTPRHKVSSTRLSQAGLPMPTDWVVAPVKMPQEIKDALREGGPRVQGTLTARHVVRGHWRMQAHGVARSERKPLWIEPHWRGRGATAISKQVSNPITASVSNAKLDLLQW